MRIRWVMLAILSVAALAGLATREVARAVQASTGPGGAVQTSSSRAVAAILRIDGAIGPATSRYVKRGLATAEARDDRLVILELDTPGGLSTSMREINRAILASAIPVVGYVAPPGARAASAGTYILYACHVAAMAPATNVGAATPVAISGRNLPTTEERKQINDAAAYIRSLAELRGRNARWAEKAVRGAASLSANAALKRHVIDLIAPSVAGLLHELDGRRVTVRNHTVVLATRGLALESIVPDWRTRFLTVITYPTLAYGLLLIGIVGLLIEGLHPGMVLPGVTGVIALIVALYAFELLSVNFAGLALIAVGIGMIIGELYLPTYGSLGIGGVIAFVVGSIMLFDTDARSLRLVMPLIGGIAFAGALIILGLATLVTRTMRRPVKTGREALIGATAEAFEDFAEEGRVRLGGELWNARTAKAVHAGEQVRIVRVEGLVLWVEPV